MGAHRNHIPASFDSIRDYLSYDAATGIFVWTANTGYRDYIGAVAGRTNARGYVAIEFSGRSYQAHRLAWFFVHGHFPDGIIDHINGVRDDNRIANLRLATGSQNAQNRGPTAGRVLPKGVYFERRDRRYRAAIRVNGQKHWLGSFLTVEDAAEAYREAATRLHGEFARVA